MKREIHHFKLAQAMFAAISAALALPTHAEVVAAMSKIGPYRSRGKGRGGLEPKHNMAAGRSKYIPHQGAREMERRRIAQWEA